MKIKNLLLGFGGCAAALSMSMSAAAAGPKVGMLIAAEDINSLNDQEKAAATWFTTNFSDGVIITPQTVNKIDATTLDAIWVHTDRLGFTTTPTEYANATMMLAQFVKDGGNLYVSKHATFLVSEIGRTADNQKPNIVSNEDGGNGTDIWYVNAYIGSWQINPDNQEPDMTQIYDRRSHAIYAGMTEHASGAGLHDYPHPAFPLEGTGTGAEMWREDHNCLWDLNAVSMTAEGKNTVEKFEAQNNCVVLGTWGHVQDYAVAGIVEFNANGDYKGKVIANGLAACEWAPRNGGNAYHSNLETLTKNTLLYLAPVSEDVETGVGAVEEAVEGTPVYYTVQGVRVENPANGLFIKVVNGKATKVVIGK